jgi:cellulose synthase operon protein C
VEPREEKDETAATVTYTWEKLDIPRLDPEPAMRGQTEISPVLEVSTFESWKSFNDWYWNLIRKQFEVSPEISKKVKELVSGADSDTDRIRAIYKFIVTDVRYNAWEFGVHGFKPYNAAAIFGRRFGDCKDKATLMTVMLKEAGIRSHPVLIYADDSRGAEDLTLPMINHFNHCITYVPPGRGHEEMYLDGTAQSHGFDELPSMDRGARVLVVRDDGGELRTVPWNTPADLSIEEEVTVRLRPDLGADLEVRARCEGDYAVYLRQSFEIAAQRRTLLEQTFGRRYASANVKSETFSNLANLDESVTFSVALDVPRFALEAPEGLALRAPEDFFGSGRSLAGIGSLETRKQDVLLSNPRRSVLRTIYEIPEGFRVKSLPRDSAIEGRFGRLQVEYRQEEPRRVVFERAIEITSPRVPVSEYASFREFAAAINRLEQDRILLEKT